MSLPKAIITDLDGCLADHRHRLHFVNGDAAFEKFPKKYFRDSYEPSTDSFLYRETDTLNHFKKDYESFYAAMDKDGVNDWASEILERFSSEIPSEYGRKILFVTERPEKFRRITSDWIGNVFGDWKLLMRPDFLPCDKENCDPNMVCGNCYIPKPDHRPAFEVKREIYLREIKDKYDVLFVLEDDQKCAEMYQELGLTVLKVMQ